MIRRQKHLLLGLAVLALAPTVLIGATESKAIKQQNLTWLINQIQEDVTLALDKNKSARSFQEWSVSGYPPADIIRNVKALSQKWPQATNYFCTSLKYLPAIDLALFEDELSKQSETVLPCLPGLKDKISEYWSAEKQQLQGAYVQSGKNILSKPNLLRNVEKELDVSEGERVLFSGGLKKGEIAITFDDGPHAVRTVRILESLKNAGVKATFFEVGENIKTLPDITKKVVLEGHVIGSHTVKHPDLKLLSMKSMTDAEEEITSGKSIAESAAGENVPFFRFPYGSRNVALQDYVRNHNMVTFLWNMDSLDWKIRDTKKLLQKAIVEVEKRGGGIILFHDIHEQTAIVIPYFLEELYSRGFATVIFIPKSAR